MTLKPLALKSLSFICHGAVLIVGAHAAASGLTTTDPNLPPIPSSYLAGTMTYGVLPINGPALLIVLSGNQFQPLSLVSRTPANATDELDFFNAAFNGQISMNGAPNQAFNSSGSSSAEFFNKVGNTTGSFFAEMLAMDLVATSPSGPFQIRESPTLPSTGQSTVTQVGGGVYHIDSFFDVFTELSIDGGNTWIPSIGSSHVELFPEPTSGLLLAIGCMCLVGKSRRVHKR